MPAATSIWLECPRDWRYARSGTHQDRVVVREDEVLIRLDLVEMLTRRAMT
jgi:hypothetical protein